MDGVLRIFDRTGIQDHDLGTERTPIRVLDLIFIPEREGWSYSISAPIPVNGRLSASGRVSVGDVYAVDPVTLTKVFILPKVSGPLQKFQFSGQLTVGRRPDNGLELRDPTISGRQCVLFSGDGAYFVQDQKSTNGTYLNGLPVSSGSPQQMYPGDELKLGRYTIRAGEGLSILNTDGGVVFHSAVTASSPGDGYALPHKRPYPYFSRAPRLYNSLPPLSVQVEDAPGIGEKPSMGMAAIAMSVPAMAISLGVSALRYGLGRRKYGKLEQQRAEIYTRYLTGVEEQLKKHASLQRELEEQLHPALGECLRRIDGPSLKLWERRPEDDDFLSLRLGLGKVPAAAKITVPPRHLQMREDEYTHVPEQLAARYAHVEGVPICCSLIKDGVCGIVGPRQETVRLAQGMAVQLAALHSYDEVKLVAVFPEAEREQWSWIRWLPHCFSPERDLRYIACTPDQVKELLPSLEAIVKERTASAQEWTFGGGNTNLPHYVFLAADPSLLAGSHILGAAMMKNQPELGLSGIILGKSLSDFPHSIHNIIRVTPSEGGMRVSLQRSGGIVELDSSEDAVPLSAYDRFARGMAPVRLTGGADGQAAQELPSYVGFLEGLHIQKMEEMDLGEFWGSARPEETMSVPIGIRSGGGLFYFDIHESVHGPHGLVAGGTGSGKSKMVQTWVASMALQFSPEDVNFILVDFKGESLLAPFKGLPHLAGFTSNIDPDVRRKFVAIESEMTRRMRLLRSGGRQKYDDIIAYRRARRLDPGMEPMPFLILVVDEFASFKEQYPEFIGPIDHLFQAGRSLGMFAILMTQKPSGKVTAQMQANLGFSWCLRVKDDADSREVIGNPDAARLRVPGRAYVKANNGDYELIQALYGLGGYDPERKEDSGGAQVFALGLNGIPLEALENQPWGDRRRPDELTVLTGYISDYCRRKRIASARPIWQAPLPQRIDLEELEREWAGCADFRSPKALLGLLDDPAHQLQAPLAHDFWTDGNLAVYGVSQSGKTTVLQTLLASMCRRYHPDQVQFYLLECGNRLRTMDCFPHVGGGAGNDEPETMNKIIKFLLKELEQRKKSFRRAGVGSPESYAEFTGTSLPAIVLLVDHINLLGEAFYELQNQIIKLSGEGPAYGMYLACTFSGVARINSSLAQNLKRTIALKLPDRMSYTPLVGRGAGEPDNLPIGRGYLRTAEGAILFQAAIPYAEIPDGQRSVMLRRLAEKLRAEWHGELPAAIRPIPDEIPYGSLEGPPFLLGMDCDSGSAASLPIPESRSLMVSAGKPETLASLLRSFIRQAQEAEGEAWLFTKRPDTYGDLLEGEHLLSDIGELDILADALVPRLRERQSTLRQDPEAVFPPVAVLVDNMKALLDQAQNDTISRLEVFVRMGKGLSFFLVCGGSAEDMNKCRFRGSNILAVTMRDGPRLIAGGPLAAHQLFENAALRLQHPALAENEGLFLKEEGGQPAFLKLMAGE